MIYKFLKWYATLGIKFFYKNVFIQYNRDLPAKYPVIYASNHPSGFYESLIFATITKYAPIFLVRSDYVSIKGLMWLFKILKLWPVYRQTEGLKNVSKNNEVFNLLYKELANKTPVCIYPEGTTKFNFRIRPIKKGLSRLALGAKKYGLDNVKIVPIAFNFVEPAEFRSNLFILSSRQMDLSNISQEQADSPAALRSLTVDVEKEMRKTVIDLNSKEQHEVFKKLQNIKVNDYASDKSLKPYETDSKLPQEITNLSSKIKELDDNQFNDLRAKTNAYFDLLYSTKTSDKAVISDGNTFIDRVKMVLGYPLFLLGIILNAIPVLLALYTRRKKIRQYEYKTVLTVLIAQFSYIIYFFVLLAVCLWLFSYKGLLVVLFPFLAWYSLKFYDFKNDYIARSNADKSGKKPELRTMRNDLKRLL